jgi:hypothetical protein
MKKQQEKKEVKEIKTTHHIGRKLDKPTDAFSKELHIIAGDNNTFQMSWCTVWVEGDEPVITKITLSAESMYLLHDTLSELIFNFNKYKLEDATP